MKILKKILPVMAAVTCYSSQAQENFLRLPSMEDMGTARFVIDEDSKSLLVVTDEETNKVISETIRELDKPVPQVLIKVLFLEVTRTDDLVYGTDFKLGDDVATGESSSVGALLGATDITRGGQVTIIEDDLHATLAALAKETELEILSRPSIMARNNEESNITIGQEVPFVRNSQITENGAIINTVEYEDIGIILTVTPHVSANNTVELDVAPEISTLTGETVQVSTGVSAPTIAKRSAETRVIVSDNQTVVIGGMMEDMETVSIEKIPILGDIPVIGKFFQKKVNETQKTELLIFLTPKVVLANGSQELSEAERARTDFIPETLEEKGSGKFFE